MKRIAMRGRIGLGKFALVDNEHFNELNAHPWYMDRHGYAMTSATLRVVRTKPVRMHRVIMRIQDLKSGHSSSSMKVDHINGDTLDNRIENLRLVTHAQNMQNRKMHKNNTTGVRGLSSFERNGKRHWMGRVYAGGKCYQKTALDRGKIESWLEKTRTKLHGDFTRDASPTPNGVRL